jgi:hypothetical protein
MKILRGVIWIKLLKLISITYLSFIESKKKSKSKYLKKKYGRKWMI